VLAGAEAQTASARYTRFQSRERVALIAFSDRVTAPVTLNFEPGHLPEARAQVQAYADRLDADGGTALFAALLQAKALAAQELQREPDRLVSIVLLTDGVSNQGPNLGAFQAMARDLKAVRIFPILFGESSVSDMSAVADLSGGKVFDGRKASLALVFKDIRGYQ
jgi:Ca-activated chloride channel family protein